MRINWKPLEYYEVLGIPPGVNIAVMVAGIGMMRVEIKEWSHTPRNYRLNQNE